MPNIKSAAKRLRQNVKNNLINRMRKSRVKTSEMHLDKAAKKGTIHQNKADRKKARLVARVAKMA